MQKHNYCLNFKFDKIKNIISADNNVKFIDKEKETVIESDKATYLKNEEIIFTEGNQAIDVKNTITGSNFKLIK